MFKTDKSDSLDHAGLIRIIYEKKEALAGLLKAQLLLQLPKGSAILYEEQDKEKNFFKGNHFPQDLPLV